LPTERSPASTAVRKSLAGLTDAAAPGSATSWQEHLALRGWAMVPGVACDADNAALHALARALGRASVSGIHTGANVEAGAVNRVEAMDMPRIDPGGKVILSTSADVFPLHSDDTFAAAPCRHVLMHCWQADPSGGGISRVADVRDILARLPTWAIERLQQPDFASPAGPLAVLFPIAGETDACGIRFNHRDFVSYGERYGPALSGEQMAALDALLQAADACEQTMLLAAGDCLVVDNHRVLHGRTAFDPASGRLLKRLRVA
jgi:hypothetical protein